ncbi:MAG: hypothetical protein R6V59_03905 [Dehalococcoidia bacterium]
MRIRDNSGDDEEHSEEVIRSLPIIARQESAGATPVPGVGGCPVEFTLSKGRIILPDQWDLSMTDHPVSAGYDEPEDEADSSEAASDPEVENGAPAESVCGERRPGSNLRFRIHLGMS